MFGAPSRFAGAGAGARYRELEIAARVEGASPHGLIQILLDELLRALETLAAADRAGTRAPALQSRAQSILHGLEAGLDFERGGEIATSLAKIYREARRLIATPPGGGRTGALEQTRTMIGDVAGAWAAIG